MTNDQTTDTTVAASLKVALTQYGESNYPNISLLVKRTEDGQVRVSAVDHLAVTLRSKDAAQLALDYVMTSAVNRGCEGWISLIATANGDIRIGLATGDDNDRKVGVFYLPAADSSAFLNALSNPGT